MTPGRVAVVLLPLSAFALCGCGAPPADRASAGPPAAISVRIVSVQQTSINRTLRVPGTLAADEEAEVAAETGGRVIATPVERGSRVTEGSALVRLAQTEAQAQAREAEANVAQLEARLAVRAGDPFDVENVPEVRTAKAARDLAAADFDRIGNLLDQRVVSQAEFDQRRTQAEAARNQHATTRNAVMQQYRMLDAARARAALARKALADTTVRAPFAGFVVERKVSVGDFVTRGTKVATVVRTNPLRLELTVPEQSIGLVRAGQPVRLSVDAVAGRVFDGRVRFVAPALRSDQRSLVVEAIVGNADGALRPGMFVTADVELAISAPALVVPTAAIRTAGGVAHVFVVNGDRVEQRMVTPGAVVGSQTEITDGLRPGETVALGEVGVLSDGARIVAAGRAAALPVPAPSPAK